MNLDIVVPDHVRRRMWAAVAVCFAAVLVGLIVLWPGRSDGADDPLGLDGDPVTASVISAAVEPCSYDPLLGCRQIELIPRAGDFDNERLSFEHPWPARSATATRSSSTSPLKSADLR